MPDESRVLRIGDWRVDPELDELSREGRTTRVEPRTMRLLLYLAAHAGRVVDVQHLLDEVWPNVVVTQGSVYQAVAELRRILGDDREHPSYIENLPRRGYRLIAPVAPWNAALSAAPSGSTAAAADSSPVMNAPSPAELQSAPAGQDRPATTATDAVAAARPLPAGRVRRNAVLGGIALAGVIVAGIALDAFWRVHHMPVTGVRVAGKAEVLVTPVTFAPPPHSIAVLPFVNMSGDPSQEYFSDGLTEEILNSLSRINELQVAARTSSFSFQGEHPDIATVAHKLNVASVLEGSVRRSGRTIRVTAQLNNAVTGFHLWSQTYDRDLGDVLKLQTDIATAVAGALKVTLLGDVAAKIELGGTRNPAAFDAYLRGAKAQTAQHSFEDLQAAIAAYTEAIRLDPNYALAFAGRSLAHSFSTLLTRSGRERIFAAARADAQQAIALAPSMTEGHMALAMLFGGTQDFTRAMAEYQQAVMLGPGNARALQPAGSFLVLMGRTDAGIATAHRVVVLDPLNPLTYLSLGLALFYARRYEEALAAWGEVVSLDPEGPQGYSGRGYAYLLLGNAERARESCAAKPEHWNNQSCLALANDRLGRHADAETALARLKALMGDGAAYDYATIYAQRGDLGEALNWLETALRLRDPFLAVLKTDPLMDPLRKEPRFQAVMRELKFPD
jgi:TolB-like protein/DNA-binding winged helix-turn-helix (wHTH) protein/Flp pilus assembly protein TadD